MNTWMRARLLLAFVAASFLSGCLTLSTANPRLAEAQPRLKKLAIIPPEVVVGNLVNSADGERLVERNEDRESTYSESLISDLSILFKAKGYTVDSRLLELNKQGSSEFKSEYLAFIREYEYATSKASLPTQGSAAFHTNVAKSLQTLSKYSDADAFLFANLVKVSRQPFSNTDRVLAGALLGVLLVDDNTYIDAVCIERGSGIILWRTNFSTGQDYFHSFSKAIQEFPSASGLATVDGRQ